MTQAPEQMKQVADVVAVGTMGATLIGWLPAAAAALTILWTLIRIYETKTVQRFVARWKDN